MERIIQPHSVYINTNFNEVKDKIKEVTAVVKDSKDYIIIEVKETELIIYYNLSIEFLKEISIQDYDFIVATIESIIREVVQGFKFKINNKLRSYRIENILRKYGKIKGVDSLLFSDRECIKEILYLI